MATITTIDMRYYSGKTVMKMKAGDTLNAANSTITVTDQDGDSVDLSGYDSGKLLVKRDLSDDDTDVVLRFDSAYGELSLANGFFYLIKAAADTKVSGGDYKFSFKVYSGAIEITIDEGDFIIDSEAVD